jgi:hypothetical protein
MFRAFRRDKAREAVGIRLNMRDPSPVPSTETADRPLDEARKDHLTAPYTWLDTLEPFAIDWELIWPM